MRRLSCSIEIRDQNSNNVYQFKNINDVKVNSSYETLTDTATFIIPRRIEFDGVQLAGDGGIFKPGDQVAIYLGYDYWNEEIFQGYISHIKPGPHVEITCEDSMYLLKRNAISKSWKGKVKLEDLLREILGDLMKGRVNVTTLEVYPPMIRDIHCPDMELENPRIVNMTPAKFLELLTKERVLKAWFRSNTLYVGFAWWPELQQDPNPEFTFNEDIITSNLTYQEANSVRLQVKAISLGKDNKKTEVEVGDPEGEQRTLHYYNLSASELKEIAERDLQRFRYTGFRGSFKTFGVPVVRHGDKIDLVDPVIADRNGTYIVRKVETSFGQNGYKQDIEIEVKV